MIDDTTIEIMKDIDYIIDDCILYANERQSLIMCARNRGGSVIIPDCVKYISDYAFYWCRNIEEIVLPDSLVYIGRYAFYGCKKLKKIKMSGENIRYIDSSNFISDGIAKLLGKKYIFVDHGIMYNIDRTVVVKCIDRKLKEVVLPESVIRIEDYAFAGCINLERISLSRNTREIGEKAFSGCIALENVFMTQSLKSIGDYAFVACDKLNLFEIDENNMNIGDYVFLK